MIDSDTLIRYIRIFSDLTNQLKYATQKRVLLEVTLIKLCRPAMDQNKDALLDRIRAIEKQLEDGAWEAPVRERVVYASDAKEAAAPKPKPELPQALNEDVKAVTKDFRMIINEASPMLRTYLKKARLSAGEGNRLLIVLPDELSASAVATPDHKEEIQSLIEQKIGKKVEIDVRQMEAGRRGGYYHGKKRRIPRRRDAGKYGKSDETGTEDAASDGRTGKGNGDKRIQCNCRRRCC